MLYFLKHLIYRYLCLLMLWFQNCLGCLFVHFWLRWVFIAACGLSLVVVSGGNSLVAVHGLLIAVASLAADMGSRACGLH